ncbi:hypothetical protein P4O66_004400 [Electrophorus voltai]|uniref:Reverse transcriptase domain-containing protein n=1 Tax=Electrophorus voltai TaxID=2609070 RepID=A0AAD8ZNH8_9TELE|nr:hypothetical protein P4O66_004400 [Electrophorus voltai]
MNKPQSVQVGNCVSSTLILSTGAPQGCVLSSLLYSLYNYDCVATSSSTTIIKFADNAVVMGLISDNDERAYLLEIKHLENWCQENNLLKVSKTKDLIVDCSKKQEQHYQPVRINKTTVERVDKFRYIGVHISQDLSWSRHTNSLAKKAHQRLYHLRCLRGFRLLSKVLRNFYTCTIESILTGNITTWFGNSTKQDRQAPQRVVRSAEHIIHKELPDLQTIYYKQCQTKARGFVKDPTYPNNRLFSLLRQGWIDGQKVSFLPNTADPNCSLGNAGMFSNSTTPDSLYDVYCFNPPGWWYKQRRRSLDITPRGNTEEYGKTVTLPLMDKEQEMVTLMSSEKGQKNDEDFTIIALEEPPEKEYLM